MTFAQALQKIRTHWRVLSHASKEGHEAVWLRIPPTDATCEGDEEWIGMRGDGSLVWAYASGFVPRESHPETASRQEVQVWQFDRKDMPKSWKVALITFAETACEHNISHRDHCFRGPQEAAQAHEQRKEGFCTLPSEQR